ncbi:MAG: hypothetical protein ACKVON_13620 [Beijerinckiaceae bacterium]
MQRRKRIILVVSAAAIIGSGLAVQGNPPPGRHVAHVQSADWVMIDKRDAFTAQVAVVSDDDTSGVLLVACTSERGTVAYTRREFIDQPPTPVIIEITSADMPVLSEEATADVAGYATDLIRKRTFVSAMQKLRGQKELQMDILGDTGQTTLSFALRSDAGFAQAALRCARIMQ